MSDDINSRLYVLVKWCSLYEIKCYCPTCEVYVNTRKNSGEFEIIREGLLD